MGQRLQGVTNVVIPYLYFFFTELHEDRLKQLRQLQKVITEDDWRYTPAEKLIGLQ